MLSRLLPDLGVLATLLASLVTVPLPLPHVATATAWIVLTCWHAARHRRLYLAALRRTTALIGCAVVVLSGFAQWAGVTAAMPWHAGSATLLVVLAALHATGRLRRVQRRRARLVTKKSYGIVTSGVSYPTQLGRKGENSTIGY